MGSIGVLLPLLSREEVQILQLLEASLKKVAPPLCGRELEAYRSYYAPCRHVLDGDFCETFALLSSSDQATVAGDIGKTVPQIQALLEELRSRAV